MQDVLAHPELRVERDGRIVARIRLHEDDPGAAPRRDLLERTNEARRDPLAPVVGRHGQIVEIDLAPLLLELPKLVGRETPDDPIPLQGRERDEGVAAQLSQIGGGIGYVELAYVKGALQAAAVQNASGDQVKPTNATAGEALGSIDLGPDLIGGNPNPKGGYPIVTFTWVLAYKTGNGDKTPLLKKAFDYMLSEEAQSKAPELGYVSLPPEVVTKAKAAANSIN